MRRDQERLNDIIEALDWIAKATGGRTQAEFLADETLCYAVAQRLTVVGEAAARLDRQIIRRYNSIPWSEIVAMRNILVHEYFGISWLLVWRTATKYAPALRRPIEEILASEFP